MTQAQKIVREWKSAPHTFALSVLFERGVVGEERFEENRFYKLPDGSTVIISDPCGGQRRIRAA